MTELRTAIYNALVSDQTLAAELTGGVHYLSAPEGTDYPMITFQRIDVVPTSWTFQRSLPAVSEAEYQVVVHAQGNATYDGQAQAERLMKRVVIALNDLTVATPTENNVLYFRAGRDLPDRSRTPSHGARTHSVGKQFRAIVSPV